MLHGCGRADVYLRSVRPCQGLSDHLSVLREVGVESLADVRYLDEVRDSPRDSTLLVPCSGTRQKRLLMPRLRCGCAQAIIKFLPLDVEYKRSLRSFVHTHTAM